MKRIIFLFALALSMNSLFAQWQLKADLSYQYPPLSFNVGKISFTSAQNGYYWLSAGGIHYASYDIKRTNDGWQTNLNVYSQGGNYDQYYISDMVFINNTIGYKLSGHSVFAAVEKTVNGGSVWTTVANNTSTFLISKLSYSSEDLGFYLRGRAWDSPNFQVVVSDHGSCSIIDFTENFVNASYINFINDSTGFLFCRDTLQNYICLQTTDSAATWNKVLQDSLNSFSEIHFPTAQTGYIAANNGIAYKTTDGGLNWTKLSTGYTKKLNSVYFLDEARGFIAGDSGLLIRTVDGGQSWTKDTTRTDLNINTVFFANPSTGYFATDEKVFKTTYVGIDETPASITNDSTLEIFPNPSNDFISIKMKTTQQTAVISIFSITGNTPIKNMQWIPESKIDISTLAKGTYVMQIVLNNTVLTKQFIKF